MKKICPKCKGEAHFCSGYRPMNIRLEQYHCDECHFTWVEEEGGRFIREGILKDPIY